MDDVGGDRLIPVEVRGRCGYVWSAEHALRLRRDHGVPGQLSGCLARAPRQNGQLGLPLTLGPEEMALLRDQGICHLVVYPELLVPRSAEQRRQLQQYEQASIEAQQRQMVVSRHKQVLEQADRIVEGKWKKLRKQGSSVTRQEVREQFLQKVTDSIRPPPADQCFLELYRQHPLLLAARPAHLQFPGSPIERVRAAVYADLWRRGYQLTDGLKFGGDFLVYLGDPLVYHATFVSRCVTDQLDPRDMACLQRLAHGCRKTLLVSCLDQTGSVVHRPVSRGRVELRPFLAQRTTQEVPAGPDRQCGAPTSQQGVRGTETSPGPADH